MVHCISRGATGYNIKIITIVFLPLEIVLFMADGVDPDEMRRYLAFYLGLHCLPKNWFKSHQYSIQRANLSRPILAVGAYWPRREKT